MSETGNSFVNYINCTGAIKIFNYNRRIDSTLYDLFLYLSMHFSIEIVRMYVNKHRYTELAAVA